MLCANFAQQSQCLTAMKVLVHQVLGGESVVHGLCNTVKNGNST
jgi:hypothetical protein